MLFSVPQLTEEDDRGDECRFTGFNALTTKPVLFLKSVTKM